MKMGKEVYELSLGSADVAIVSSDYVTDKLLSVRDNIAVLSQMYKSIKMPSGFKQAKAPACNSSTLTVTYVAEGSTVPLSNYTFVSNDVVPFKQGIHVAIDQESIKQAGNALIDYVSEEMGSKLNQVLETQAMTVCLDLRLGTLTNSDFVGGTLATATGSVPIFEILTVGGGATISQVNYAEGKIQLSSSVSTATITFSYANKVQTSGLYMSPANYGTIKVRDVLNMRATLSANSIHADCVFLSDADVSEFAYDAGNLFNPVVEDDLNGMIGKLLDLKVLSSNVIPQGNAIIVQGDRLGYDVQGRGLFAVSKYEPSEDSYHIWSYSENRFSDGDSFAVCLITNGQANAGSI
jgi:Fe-S cluster assembly iron-binding protein IscA